MEQLKNNIGNVSTQNYRTNQKSKTKDWEFRTCHAYTITTCRDGRTRVSGLSHQTRAKPLNSRLISRSTFTTEPLNQSATGN